MDNYDQLREIINTVTGDKTLSQLYITLLTHGPLPISQLAKKSGVERTLVYRSIDKMRDSHLLEVQIHEKRQIYKASSLESVRYLLTRKQDELSRLNTTLDHVQSQIKIPKISETRVQFYSGVEGIKQMLWNQVKAKTEIVSLLSENIQSHTGEVFFNRWVDACNSHNLTLRSLIDENFINQQIRWYGTFGHSLKNWSARKLPQNSSSIPHRTTIYDNVTTYFNWQDIDVFGIEIYNQSIADTQREYFELLWQKSTSL